MTIIQTMDSSACFSNDMRYRYWLSRDWKPEISRVVFIMLNPSTADARKDDPTIKRCIDFAHTWGFGGIHVVNLFAFRATDPKRLRKERDPVGKHNLCMIDTAIGHPRTGMVVAAWGAIEGYRDHIREVIEIAIRSRPLYCISTTKNGNPSHPLYLPAILKPQIFAEKRGTP